MFFSAHHPHNLSQALKIPESKEDLAKVKFLSRSHAEKIITDSKTQANPLGYIMITCKEFLEEYKNLYSFMKKASRSKNVVLPDSELWPCLEKEIVAMLFARLELTEIIKFPINFLCRLDVLEYAAQYLPPQACANHPLLNSEMMVVERMINHSNCNSFTVDDLSLIKLSTQYREDPKALEKLVHCLEDIGTAKTLFLGAMLLMGFIKCQFNKYELAESYQEYYIKRTYDGICMALRAYELDPSLRIEIKDFFEWAYLEKICDFPEVENASRLDNLFKLMKALLREFNDKFEARLTADKPENLIEHPPQQLSLRHCYV